MHLNRKNISWPALTISALALFFLAATLLTPNTSAQKIKQLPPPPPVPRYKPKPTPTPAPIEYDVVRVTSNLVVVPVSVTDAQGQPMRNLKPDDFRIEEDGRPQEIAQLGDPEQVPLDIALLVDDFHGLIQHLEAGGASLKECSPGQNWGRRPNGRKYAICFDPVGHQIELMENLG